MTWSPTPATRASLSSLLESDGSLVDLYAFDATVAIWQRTVDAIVSSLQWEFRVDGETAPLASIEELMVNRSESSPLLQVTVGLAAINCHFFDDGELEFDIDPRQMSDQEAFDDVLGFMSLVSSASGLPVRMTPENSRSNLITACRPTTVGDVEWFAWPREIKLRPEFGSGPLWCRVEPHYLDPLGVPVEGGLARDLHAWQEAYDDILADYPPDSKFPTPADEVEFWRTGASLADRLRDATPPWVEIVYERQLGDALDRFEEAAIEWAGTAYGKPLVDAALAALVAGLDTPTLRVLAGAPAKFADEEASECAEAVFDELGLVVPEKLTDDAFVALAKLKAKRFLSSGESPAARLAGDISALHTQSGYRSELSDLAALAEWYVIIDMDLVQGDTSALDDEVRIEAERLVAGLPIRGRRIGDPYMAQSPSDTPLGERMTKWLKFRGRAE